ncbi:MAG: sn-glycerol-3-phosphate ABC transporter ATP-binding protein UgpC [Oligoflexales bacterium]|nr:sn-glycerol-3-phosphate ABC transporter ATP-binding protein UgpC [Oligoflexales bacterium]
MCKLILKNVSKTYDGKNWILSNINLEIEEGEFVVLVGPSGCGKSTLLRMIAGLETPSQGEIILGDALLNDVPPVKRDIAMVFQDYALYPHMTVAENLSFGLRIRKVPKEQIEAKLQEAAQMLNIQKLLDRKPAELSGGQRQRVAIGRAIVREPKLFLFDEPLSNLDAKLRAEMRIDLASLHRRVGKTSIYVTHDQQEAMTLADRIVILDHGTVQQVGSPMDIYHQPANTTVATFVGSPSMNLLEGDLSLDNNKQFRINNQTLTLESKIRTPKQAGRYYVGIRPEDLGVAFDQQNLSNGQPVLSFDGKLLLKELHGHETHLVIDVGGKPLIARISGREQMKFLRDKKPGDLLKVPLTQEHLHWFKDQSGERIQELN